MKSSILAILLLLAASLAAHAQDEPVTAPDENFPVLGLGVHAFNADGEMPQELLLTFNPSRTFRLEGKFGRQTSSYSFEGNSTKMTFNSFGLSGYGVCPIGKTNVYGGVAFTLWIDKSNSSSQGVESEGTTSKRQFFGPVVGGEYFFSSHFSAGAEAGMNWISFEDDDPDTLGKWSMSQSYSQLTVHFYFL